VIIGVAFENCLVARGNVIMPPIVRLLGNVDFSGCSSPEATHFEFDCGGKACDPATAALTTDLHITEHSDRGVCGSCGKGV